ncbi:MAG: hypothetical protein U0031_13905 [Thermomicrobiales bacterium]
MAATAMSQTLVTFGCDEDQGGAHHAALVFGHAGRSIAHDLAVPEGIDLVLRPPQLPESQPGER